MNQVAPAVAQDLKLDVVGVFDEFLDVNARIAKGLFRLAAGGMVALDQRHVVMGRAHAFAATTGDRLDHDRVANSFGDGQGVLLVLHGAFGTGRSRHAGLASEGPAGGFVLQGVHGSGTWPNEANIAAFAYVGEMGVLREKTVAGMDGINIGDLGGADDPVNAEVTFAAGCFPDADGLVRHLHVHGVGIHFGINRHRADI